VQNRPGTAPGHYATSRRRNAAEPAIHIFDYDAQNISEHQDIAAATAPLSPGAHRWVHVQGVPSIGLLDTLKAQHAVDELVLEDLINRERRPKLTMFGDDLLAVLLIPMDNQFSQLSIYVSKSVTWSFCDRVIPALEHIQDRLRLQSSKLRSGDNLFMAYALMDLVVDRFFEHLEAAGDDLELLEADLEQNPSRDVLKGTHDIRALMMVTRKHAWATRDLVTQFQRYIIDLSHPALERLLQDCYDHIVAVVDLSETYREIATAVIEVHLSIASHRLNETIRFLTVITVLFVPATFIVGVYGMNFDRSYPFNMPELSWPFGYLTIMGLILASMVAMVVYFKRSRWF
jgi:magnesium transporter